MTASSDFPRLRTLDGLHLQSTLVLPEAPAEHAAVLVHGGGVTRDEGGFFTRLAAGLAEAGIASLRFDHRGHGESEGRQQDLTLSSMLNDIRVAVAAIRARTTLPKAGLIGASICGYYAAKRPDEIERLVLLNPRLDYKKRTIDNRVYWTEQGYIEFSPSLKHGYGILNEVFWLKPNEVLGEIAAPTLIVHGTKDTFVPVESSRAALAHLTTEHRLLEIDGAQHGFAVHDDPTYADPQSQEWQAFVIREVTDWFSC
ncbi:alpha/beta hydrolase [Saccharothrix syringae]|uniref:Alpha/beta fold hydrolase n=1 Tax=Saccharothrix syringae TaxID=103733 RepID=A0A5Q0GTG1_SACSY|nr:alpha/beta fold hydrolase [Saccharothrix syringae]QFZ17376.1 alpha/beta fold hydrolase [Saccharothrix syringae]